MKKIFTILSIVLAINIANAQKTDLIFSEYIEGSSNNKGLEIYNGTGNTVDLSQYSIKQSVNGGDWQYTHTFPAGATLANGAVWVIITSQVDPALFPAANANEVLSYPSVTHHNGDDARALVKGETIIDVIGIPTEDPGDGWSVAGIANATKDHTLVRKSSVTGGNINWTAASGTNSTDSEWIVYEVNDFSHLGTHSMSVGIDDNGVQVETYSLSQNYPNPFNPSTQINFSLAENGFVSLIVFNMLGQKVATLISREMTSGVHNFNFDASNLSSGIYFYTLKSANFSATKKMILMK